MPHREPESRSAPRSLLATALLIPAAVSSAGTPTGPGPHITASAAAQMETLASIDDARTALQRKIDSRLFLGLLHRRRTRGWLR